MAAAPRRLPTATELFDWAEATYPQYFPSRRTNQALAPYVFRHYPETGNYVGLAGDAIVVLGPISGGEVLQVGTLAAFACVVIPAECNTAPVASAGPAQALHVGAVVTLNGSASVDPDGDELTFAWSITKPSGSAAALTSATSPMPTFVADKAGSYVATLVVRDKYASATAKVTITVSAVNSPPVAHAGQGQSVVVGSVATLDGSASSDAEGSALTYLWTMMSKPAGSSATLTGATTAKPTFVADKAGSYALTLVVSDGKASSSPVTVTVTAAPANAAPTANAGPSQVVIGGNVITLDGSLSSDPNGDPLQFQWAFTSKPEGSAAVLVNAQSSNPTFYPDVPGIYVVGLIVSDGRLLSQDATVSITALPAYVDLLLAGGDKYDVYLGCLTCTPVESDAVCNQSTAYGSRSGAHSIWNQSGTYGSRSSAYSPWAPLASTPPAIIGTDGGFYGFFTSNTYMGNRTSVPFVVGTLAVYAVRQSLDDARAYLCGN